MEIVTPSTLVFVKAPIPGKVKTRLIPQLGVDGATALYRALVQDTLTIAARCGPFAIAYDPDPALPNCDWIWDGKPPAYHWFAQQGATLGERLVHAIGQVYQRTRQPVIVIGSDLPTLSTAHLEDAQRFLHAYAVVIGPATDGGYYLIALQTPLPWLFSDIAWSTPEVYEQTRARLAERDIVPALLPPEADIDCPEDLTHWLLANPSTFPRTLAVAKKFIQNPT